VGADAVAGVLARRAGVTVRESAARTAVGAGGSDPTEALPESGAAMKATNSTMPPITGFYSSIQAS